MTTCKHQQGKRDFNSRVTQSFENGQNKIQQKLKPANSEQK